MMRPVDLHSIIRQMPVVFSKCQQSPEDEGSFHQLPAQMIIPVNLHGTLANYSIQTTAYSRKFKQSLKVPPVSGENAGILHHLPA